MEGPSTDRTLSIAVLTSKRQSYSVRRLIEEGRKRGHRMRALDPMAFSILLDYDEPMLHYKSKPLSKYDAVIPRVASSSAQFGAAVVRQFEQMGVFCANSSNAIFTSRDKFRASQTMTKRGIGIPRTAFVADPSAVEGAVDYLGGAPVVVKLVTGSQGIGVTLAEHRQTAIALVDMLQSLGSETLMQSFISESRGRDIRAFVVDGRVVAAMRRTAVGDEFRSNIHRGASAQAVDLSEEYREAALRAAQVIGLRVAGVDILEGNDGPMVIEVNSSPGLEGIEGATGIDVAGTILDFVERECHLPEFDIRQRLRMAHGYGILEVGIGPKSPLVDRSIGGSELAVPEIRVLTVTRGGGAIPLPKDDFVFQAGDEAVVFGPTEMLRSLAPLRGRKRRPPKPTQA